MKSLRALALSLVLGGLWLQPAIAAEQGFYAGGSLGESDDEILNETDSGYKLFAGYEFNRNAAVEVAFVDLGEFVGGVLDQYGLAFQFVGKLPVSNQMNLFGKVGLFNWTVDVFGLTDDGTDPTYGAGVEFRFTEQLAGRVEWETFQDIAGGDVDLISVGLSVRF